MRLRVYATDERPSVRLSVPSIDSSSGWFAAEQEITGCSGRVISASNCGVRRLRFVFIATAAAT